MTDAARGIAYLDSSALVKLVITEAESSALRQFLAAHPRRASCGLARVEVIRAVHPHGGKALARARRLLKRIDLLDLDDELLEDAAALDAGVLRSLDAIHLGAARTLADDLEVVVTYDDRMLAAGELLGLPVASPGRELRVR